MTEEQLLNKFEGTRLNIELDLLLEIEAELMEPHVDSFVTIQSLIHEKRTRLREIQ